MGNRMLRNLSYRAELPAWIRRGGRDQRKCREATLAERAGWLIKFQQRIFLEPGRPPVCTRYGSFAKFLERAATPPDPGGESACLKNFDFLCKVPVLRASSEFSILNERKREDL
jgi:hypothetical protein